MSRRAHHATPHPWWKGWWRSHQPQSSHISLRADGEIHWCRCHFPGDLDYPDSGSSSLPFVCLVSFPLSVWIFPYVCNQCPWLYALLLFYNCWASLVAQMVRNLPGMQETWVRSVGQEDPPEKGMATHSSILSWQISWTDEPGGPESMELQRVRHDWTWTTLCYAIISMV